MDLLYSHVYGPNPVAYELSKEALILHEGTLTELEISEGILWSNVEFHNP